MEQKEISFSGINLTPYSDISPDGQLSHCVGLELHSGSLRPSSIHGTEFSFSDAGGTDAKLEYIHTMSHYTVFIFVKDNTVFYSVLSGTTLGIIRQLITLNTIYRVNSVGNTLLILGSSGIEYAIYKKGSYKCIGMKPPELIWNFGLVGKSMAVGPTDYSIPLARGTAETALDDEASAAITVPVISQINDMLDRITKEGKMAYPFFVRYAYRMFDGSTHSMLSAPILLVPSSFCSPSVVNDSYTKGRDTIECKSTIYIAYGSLHYYNLSIPEGLGDWADIIDGVDLYMSPQIYSYDPSGAIKSVETAANVMQSTDIMFWPYIREDQDSRPGDTNVDLPPVPRKLTEHFQWISTTLGGWKIPTVEEKAFYDRINEMDLFYLIKSYSLAEFMALPATGRIQMSESLLRNLTLQDRLRDEEDYQSHHQLVGRGCFVYNKRANIYDISMRMFQGFKPDTMNMNNYNGSGDSVFTIFVFINKNGQEIITRAISSVPQLDMGYYLYYPDINAYKMMVFKGNVTEGSTGQGVSISLKRHPFLNGSYYFDKMNPVTGFSSMAVPYTTSDFYYDSNKMYTSEVNNPFYFPVNGIYTVGAGGIIGVSSIATALSLGQYGDFPLLFFCTDGNYAMRVDSEGLYSTISSTQRDICVNPDSITPIDSEVIFVSNRGVVVTEGSKIDLLSGNVDGVPDELPEGITTSLSYPLTNPKGVFKDCLVSYDYSNHRLLFFSKVEDVAYAYYMENSTWSTLSIKSPRSVLNLYPYSFVQKSDGTIIRMDKSYDYSTENSGNGLLCTRPLKLDSLQLKRIMQIVLQGVFSKPQLISVYASQDCTNWFKMGTSTRKRIGAMVGHKFKYYKFVIQTSLSETENISGIRFSFDISTENRLR